jgi:hypothetical protein
MRDAILVLGGAIGGIAIIAGLLWVWLFRQTFR